MKARAVWMVLAGLAVAALVAGGVVWWKHNYKQVEEEIELPRTGEIIWNPLYVLGLALKKDGLQVQSRQRLLGGSSGLGRRDTVVLYGDPQQLDAAESRQLLAWVAAGGHLVMRTSQPQPFDDLRPTPLFDALGVALIEPDRGSDEDEEDARSTCTAMYVPGQESHVEFCGGRQFVLTGAGPLRSWGDPESGYVYARVVHGRGHVDVAAELDFLRNDSIDDVPHVALARQILAPNYRAGTVHLIYAGALPSIWELLLQRAWMAWLPMLLVLLGWLWRRTQRFGPLLPSPSAERRSLLEHIVASGQHAWRYGYGHVLHAAAREAFLTRLRRRDPQAAALEGEVQVAQIAQRLQCSPAEIRDALATPVARDANAFRTRIATLIRLRNQL
ncbi:DUF4350 domain-containing protein [Montanilutibacter psychrotolerans]|uniref:DUF4350 domain-containing protein n=1 Tax=Montanilutibacter psychrotolerans TaxID=1327343 RepID=A0A3M8SWU8_9GAMM|nr:DUF4350 domain-containing protein [Lysobacter psychrotolerans]RNF83926.1 DUF4350 domain-containing protein [Lysobacter psychrotolerans]